MNDDPLNYHDDADKCQALNELVSMTACIGAVDSETVHVEMTPPIGFAPIGDAEFPRVVDCVNRMGNVRDLDLSETAITDQSAPHLGRLQTVRYLALACTRFSDRGVPYLQQIPTLKELALSGTSISDECVDELLRLSNLTFLQIYGTQISPKGIAKLKAGLPRTKIECSGSCSGE
jgi:hypothetical protein